MEFLGKEFYEWEKVCFCKCFDLLSNMAKNYQHVIHFKM